MHLWIHSDKGVKGIVGHFRKYTFSLSFRELPKKIDTRYHI